MSRIFGTVFYFYCVAFSVNRTTSTVRAGVRSFYGAADAHVTGNVLHKSAKKRADWFVGVTPELPPYLV